MAKTKSVFILVLLSILLFCSSTTNALNSEVEKFPRKDVQGNGPFPYNYRIIDKSIHVGGHPLNPQTKFNNTDEQIWSILSYLKSQGVKTIIDLENTGWIQERYAYFLEHSEIKRIHVPMHAFKVPNKKEWKTIKQAIKDGPVYIHCKWGADRAGSVVARYLVEEKGYPPKVAYAAVISKGSYAGPIGGLKTSAAYYFLKRFIFEGP